RFSGRDGLRVVPILISPKPGGRPVPRRLADRYKLCSAATRHGSNLGSYWFRGYKGLQPPRSMSFFREGWPPCRSRDKAWGQVGFSLVLRLRGTAALQVRNDH